MNLFGLFKKGKPAPTVPEVAGMVIPATHLQALQPSDQMLISYPRSGNTWMRHLLKDILVLSHPEISEEPNPNHLVPDIHHTPPEHPAQKEFGMPTRILKSHNLHDVRAYRSVYLFRTAADSLLSYYHFGILKEQAWSIAGESPDDFCRRFLPTWEEHIGVALEMHKAAPDRVLFVSYERLLADGPAELRRVVDFYGIPATDEVLVKANEKNAFDKLRAKEQAKKPDAKGFFFRKGKAGSASEELKAETLSFLEERTRAAYSESLRLASN